MDDLPQRLNIRYLKKKIFCSVLLSNCSTLLMLFYGLCRSHHLPFATFLCFLNIFPYIFFKTWEPLQKKRWKKKLFLLVKLGVMCLEVDLSCVRNENNWTLIKYWHFGTENCIAQTKVGIKTKFVWDPSEKKVGYFTPTKF